MPESIGDLIMIALALTVVWFLGGSFASGEHRGRHGMKGLKTPSRPSQSYPVTKRERS
jgi:hypothetical protein